MVGVLGSLRSEKGQKRMKALTVRATVHSEVGFHSSDNIHLAYAGTTAPTPGHSRSI